MSILNSIIKKEALHIVRDRRTMLITLFIPLMLLLLFGFAISTEVNNVRVAVVSERHDDRTRTIIQRLEANEYISLAGMAAPTEAEQLLQSGRVDAVLLLRPDGADLQRQIMVDASNPTIARTMTSYIGSITGASAMPAATTRILYNPQMKSSYNFVPGIMGMIFILICAIMTSVSIVREKESGTMDLLLVSPVRPAAIIIGKLIPYLLLSCVILALMLLMAYTVLGLPLSATVLSVVLVSLLYIVVSLMLGLMISSMVSRQISALIISAVVLMVPVIMLSGMIFPVDNMPAVLQGISAIVPARWYIEAMRKLMIQQLELQHVAKEVTILGAMTLALLAVQPVKFKSKNK